MLLEASLEEARETTAKAFQGLLVPLMRRGLIEGVYGSDGSDVSPSEVLLMADGKDGVRSTRLGLNDWQHFHILHIYIA